MTPCQTVRMVGSLDFAPGHLATSYTIPRFYPGVSMAGDHHQKTICLWSLCTGGEESSAVCIWTTLCARDWSQVHLVS